MSLNFKSFIKIRFLLGIFIPIFLLFFGIIIYMPKDKNAQAAYILNPNNRDIVELGKSVYVQNCASCHGVKLEGQKDWMSRLPDGLMPAPPHDETGHTWHHSDKYLFMITKYGIEDIIGQNYANNMPAYENILSDKEIISVLSYIKSTWPNKVKKIHDQINDRQKSK
jgi:mono/diheme cytochrome c family protein|tara:strand:- start:298 stop:798 length:501 start_codon:yes stop_codon:yes gene_type:complete